MPYITSEAAGQITFPNKIQAMLCNGVTIRSYERACHFYVSKSNGAIMAKTIEALTTKSHWEANETSYTWNVKPARRNSSRVDYFPKPS
jgi:hypothetical protein